MQAPQNKRIHIYYVVKVTLWFKRGLKTIDFVLFPSGPHFSSRIKTDKRIFLSPFTLVSNTVFHHRLFVLAGVMWYRRQETRGDGVAGRSLENCSANSFYHPFQPYCFTHSIYDPASILKVKRPVCERGWLTEASVKGKSATHLCSFSPANNLTWHNMEICHSGMIRKVGLKWASIICEKR